MVLAQQARAIWPSMPAFMATDRHQEQGTPTHTLTLIIIGAKKITADCQCISQAALEQMAKNMLRVIMLFS